MPSLTSPAPRGGSPVRADPSRRRLALAALAAPVLAGLGCSTRKQMPAVGFTLLDGSKSSTLHLRGQVVLLKFWATTCAVCVRKMPTLVELQRDYAPRGFTTLAVAMQWDPPASVAHFAESRQLPFGVAIDNTGDIARAFGDVQATPTTFLLDRRGAVARSHVGEFDVVALRRQLERLLDEV